MAQLEGLLQGIAAADGVRAVVVAGSDGLLIHGSQQGGQEDLEAVAAIAASIVGSLQSLSKEMERKELQEAIATFADSTVLLQPVGQEALLAVLLSGAGNLGRIRFLVHKRMPEIATTIREM